MRKTALNRDGYFLIDVLVVIGIVGVVAVAAVPYIRDFQPRLTLDSAKKQIASDLRYTQQLAVTEQSLHGVEFDEIMDTYEVVKMDPDGSTSVIKSRELAKGVGIKEVVNSDDGLVEFNSYGGVDEACRVVLEHTNGDVGQVIIKPSGYISVK
jgi:Tfp pilus assembly protein FimT